MSFNFQATFLQFSVMQKKPVAGETSHVEYRIGRLRPASPHMRKNLPGKKP
jgi:hypothetical protein